MRHDSAMLCQHEAHPTTELVVRAPQFPSAWLRGQVLFLALELAPPLVQTVKITSAAQIPSAKSTLPPNATARPGNTAYRRRWPQRDRRLGESGAPLLHPSGEQERQWARINLLPPVLSIQHSS